MNAGSTPRGILGCHLEDKLTQLFGGRLPSQDSVRFGYPPPVEAKAGAVPAYNSVRGNDNERIFPVRPERPKGDPKESIELSEAGSLATRLRVVSCWRRAIFSRIRWRREPKKRGINPKKRRSRLSIVSRYSKRLRQCPSSWMRGRPRRMTLAVPFLLCVGRKRECAVAIT